MKCDLDDAFEKWKEENEENLKEKFLDTHDFYSYLEESWREFQDNEGLIDERNEFDFEEDSLADAIEISKKENLS